MRAAAAAAPPAGREKVERRVFDKRRAPQIQFLNRFRVFSEAFHVGEGPSHGRWVCCRLQKKIKKILGNHLNFVTVSLF